MDRKPKAPPFPVGAQLRYTGDRRVWYEIDGQRIPLIEPGMIVLIDETRPGRRGTLRQLHDEDEDDNGEPILDTTRDAYSVYVNVSGQRRIIWPADAHEWELVRDRPGI